MMNYMKSLLLSLAFGAVSFINTSFASGLTVDGLKKSNIQPMQTEEIKTLIIGKILVVRNTETLANYGARFDTNGKRILQQVSAQRDGPRIIYKTLGDAKNANIADYEIKNNRLITRFDDQTFEMMIFKVKDTYYGARSTDGGALNWELVLVTK